MVISDRPRAFRTRLTASALRKLCELAMALLCDLPTAAWDEHEDLILVRAERGSWPTESGDNRFAPWSEAMSLLYQTSTFRYFSDSESIQPKELRPACDKCPTDLSLDPEG